MVLQSERLKPLIAEALGTFVLTAVVLFSVNNSSFPVGTPVLAALVLAVFVYTFGPISGTHLNPAVSIGLASIGKIKTKTMFLYIFAQVIGALLAKATLFFFVSEPVPVVMLSTFSITAAELLGATIFAIGICSVVLAKTPKNASGLIIGSSLLIGISLAAIASQGVLNPAIALALGPWSLAYLLGPTIGSVLGFKIYAYLSR